MHSSRVPAQRWKDCWLHKRVLWQEVKGVCDLAGLLPAWQMNALFPCMHCIAFKCIWASHIPWTQSSPSFKGLPVFSNPLMCHCVEHNATDCWPDSESDSRKCYHTLISYSAKSSQSSNRSQGRQWTQKWQCRDWRDSGEDKKKVAAFHLALNIDE